MSANKLRLFALLAAGTMVTAMTPVASLAGTPVQYRYDAPVDNHYYVDRYGTMRNRFGFPVDSSGEEMAPTAPPCSECIWLPTHKETVRGQTMWIPGHWERLPGYRPPQPRPRIEDRT